MELYEVIHMQFFFYVDTSLTTIESWSIGEDGSILDWSNSNWDRDGTSSSIYIRGIYRRPTVGISFGGGELASVASTVNGDSDLPTWTPAWVDAPSAWSVEIVFSIEFSGWSWGWYCRLFLIWHLKGLNFFLYYNSFNSQSLGNFEWIFSKIGCLLSWLSHK